MVKIVDSTGSSYGVEVTSENKLQTDTVTRSITQHVNEIYAEHYSLVFEGIDPAGADDYFVYLKNTGTKSIHLTKFRFKSTVVGTVELHHVTGTASYASDTDISPANRFLGSTNTPVMIAKTDTNTTGLVNANTLIRLTLSTANTDFIDDAPSHIILPPGQSAAVLWDTSTGILAGTIDMYVDQE